MFTATCAYRPTVTGPIFLPDDIESDCRAELCVSFNPLAYYPAEPDVGAGPDFDAEICGIQFRDCGDDNAPWRALTGRTRKTALQFLEAHCRAEMWRQAEEETAEAFGIHWSAP